MSAWREETSDRERCLRGERRRVTEGKRKMKGIGLREGVANIVGFVTKAQACILKTHTIICSDNEPGQDM
jgi:hypothetical protein